jgi:hypothetical protein
MNAGSSPFSPIGNNPLVPVMGNGGNGVNLNFIGDVTFVTHQPLHNPDPSFMMAQQQMQMMQQSEFYTILDWNYKIATDKSNIWDSEFRQACAKRVQEMMTPPAQENNNNPENNGQQ